MVSPGSGKNFAKLSIADMRRESGTCNVCSAPCSSCMHHKRTLMGSKNDEFSDENCRLGEANHSPMDEDGVTSLRSKACESLQHAVSETSNMLSVNSSHDSLSENADSRRTLSNKFQDSKSLDGLDDNTSSISRASDANLANGSHLRDSDRINMSCSSASVNHPVGERSGSAPSFETSNLSETPAFKDVAAGHSSPKVQSPSAQSWSSKSLSSSPGLMDLERDSCSHIPEKLSECCMGNIDSLLTKETVPIIGSVDKCLADKDSLNVGTANVSLKIYPKSEANNENDIGTARDEAHKSSVQDGQGEKSEDVVEGGRDMQEPKSEDESDESDVLEHDVKVCDICGDAGREDLLAICSRCSDGAEHTYCMREMLQKVPDGDWLCEECKCAEETENQRLDVIERNTLKVGSTSQISGKRHSENIEAAPAAKRQALESNIGSPIASSPKKITALSRESSFKSLDKGKVKPGQQMPIRNHSGSDNMECSRSATTGPRVPVPKGLLSKSNSFNTLNSKARVKLDEVAPQKQKGAGEHSSKNIEPPARLISKSMSFKAVNLGRSNATESKVKMLSSKSIPALESKGSRHAKEWGALDRKTLSRGDRPLVSSTTSSSVILTTKSDQKLTPRTETSKPSSVNNNYREVKVTQDGKSSFLSKSSSSLGRKGVEPPVGSEKTSSSADETLQDMVPRSREATNQIEKTRDSSNDRSLSGINTASKSAFCQKCKEIGHPTESCTLGSAQEPTEVSSTRSTKEEMHKGNRLRAALRAAMLRRPEIYKKKEIPNQTDELSTSGTDLNCEVTSQDQVLVSNPPNNSISTELTQVGQKVNENFSSETAKCSSVNDVKQLNVCPTDSCSQPVDSNSVDPSGKPAASELPKQALPISLVLPKMPIIPEYEYIWQGVFEVHREGKPPDSCAGIQAHLSTCASPKVRQMANKFPTEISFNEVPRLSSWPSQFHQSGAKEDHIALYFFAKDIESYERYYKGLLDHMTRNDLALKGIVDGVELLIFPSNQLPEKSQRWNMMSFLWGVFRGRRMKNSDSAKICIPSLNVMPDEKDFPASGLPKHVDEESLAYDRKSSMVLASTCPDQGHVTFSRNSDIKESFFDQKHIGSQVYIEKKDSKLGPQIKLEKQDTKFDAKSSSRIPTGSAQLCQEMKPIVPSMKDSLTPHGPDRESKPFPEQMVTSVSSKIGEGKADSDSSVKPESRIPSAGDQEIHAAGMTSEKKSSDIMNSVGNQARPKRKPKDDHYIDIEAGFHGDATFKGVNYQQSNANTLQHIDLSDTVMQACAVAPQRMSWNEVNCKLEDGASASKKLKTGLSGIYGCGSSGVIDSFDERFPSLANDFGSCSSVEDKVCEEACDEKIIREDLGNMERTFFPVDISDKNDPLLGQNIMSLKGPHDYENHFRDGIPNLELALGGETKPPQKGMLPFFLEAVDEKNSHEKSADCLAEEPEDDSVSASLSLSLSFPSLNKEPVKPVSKTQQHLPDGNHVNTSLLLFGRFTDK